MAGQQPGQGGFSQPFGQPFGQGFGQPATNPAAFTFGAAVPPAAPPAQPAAFNFGQPQPQPPAQQPSSFTFGQPAATPPPGFAQQQPPAPSFNAPSTFNFGASQAAATPPAPRSFDFGSARRKQGQKSPPVVAPAQQPGTIAEQDEEDEFDYEAAKQAALASMPSFQGVGGGGAPAPSAAAAAGGGKKGPMSKLGGQGMSRPPPPPPRRVTPQTQAQAQGEDPAEVARRNQRANRFAPVSASAAPPVAHTQVPTPAAGPLAGRISRPSSAAFPVAPTNGTEGDASGGGGMNEYDEDGFGGAGRGPIVGTCEDMCPASERERRQNMSDIQIFERVDPNNPNLTSPELAVRRFARTVDDPHPSEFRTRGALTRTMDHLRRLLDRTDARFGLIHKFLWDRYRSVRQDLYIQGIADDFAISIYEEIVRFHVLCEHELCGEDQSVTDMEGFNSHLNMEQMNKALISLNEMYIKAAAEGRPAQNEAEFRTYHLVSLMAQHGKFKGDQQAFLSTLQALRPEVRGAPMVQWALRLRAAFVAGNFVRFFKLVDEATYLPACAAHTYFPAVRARALRTLSETLAPTSTRPTAVEVSWLRHVLRLDSDEEVLSLAASHGFTETATTVEGDGGELALLFIKGQYVDPPPPQIKRPSAWITAKAPGLRSVCVTSPAGRPLTPAEIAVLAEERRKQEQAHAQALAAAKAAATARAQIQLDQLKSQAAEREKREKEAFERQQLEAAARQQEEVARQQAQQAEQARLEALQRAKEEADRQRQLEAAAEAQRREAERVKREAAERAAAEAAHRAAAAAEARRIEAERRRREAEEAERRRRIEEERRKAEELRRKVEALRVRVFERRYFSKWVAQMRRLVAERRRKERIAASLKACRVGIVPLQPGEVSAAEAALGGLGLGAEEAAQHAEPLSPPQQAQHAKRGALDLASLLAPLLAQNNPGTRSLFYKVAVLGSSIPKDGSGSSTINHLLKWLHLQLSCGKIAPSAAGSIYLDGPVEIELRRGGSSAGSAVLRTCVSVPPPAAGLSSANSALAGASGVIIACAGGEDIARATAKEVAALLSPAAPALPVLLVGSSDDQAQGWLRTWQEYCPHSQPHAISVSSGNNTKSGVVAPYSISQLVQGLRWLAARAPVQPVLAVTRLEDATRDALAVEMMGSTISNQSNSPSSSLKSAISIVASVVKAAGASPESAWQWPPPELCEGPLKGWYTKSTQAALLSALQRCLGSGDSISHLIGDGEASVQQFVRVGQLVTMEQPLVMPATVHAEFCVALAKTREQAAARAAQAARSKHAVLDGEMLLRSDGNGTRSPVRQQKRKWRHSPEGSSERQFDTDANARLRQSLVSLEESLAVERSNEQQFDRELVQVAGGLGLDLPTSQAPFDETAAISIVEVEEDKVESRNGQLSDGFGQLRALQELNADLERERKASQVLWQRMRATTSMLL